MHGGAFLGGDGTYSRFNPGLFVERELVVVTTNYRVGALGTKFILARIFIIIRKIINYFHIYVYHFKDF